MIVHQKTKKKKKISMHFSYISSDKTCSFQCDLIKSQCTALNTSNNKKCQQTTFHLPYCSHHTHSLLGLVVKKSNIPHAGHGLFAIRDFKKLEVITPYIGTVLSNKEATERYGSALNDLVPYGVRLNASSIVDSACLRGIGSFANDGKSKKLNNAHIIIDKSQNVYIQATKKILGGDEILVDYGSQYFSIPNEETKPIFQTF